MDRFAAVERALRTAAPHTLLDVVTAALQEAYAATRVELRMADYSVTTLQTVGSLPGTTEPVPIHDSPQGRAFGAQEPYVETDLTERGGRVHLPITIRGDRMGVLTVSLPEHEYFTGLPQEIQPLCEALGHEIVVAERDTDLYLLARRAARLTLAAELQWQLLPGHSLSRTEYALGAHLEPAYAIFGDNYDWSASAEHLTLTVTNGMGDGINAALLTNLAINALRNARRAGLGPADQAVLADQAVYAQYQGAAYVSVLLLRFTLATGDVEIVDAGSPRMWRMRGGSAEPLSFDAQLPLGMFEDTQYVTEHLRVQPGDRLLIGSDGVYDTVSRAGERYGERALARSLNATRLLPPPQVPRAVLREHAGYRGDTPLDDDALIVCLDWYGR
ncbi:PP2C family protein-serine/threonine phosphatase [Streptomyces sp. NPDC004647]|uniref:PP2C family protein-serine/threonine phosphatase n=1 Tax=Streptomyces sp. NPDC004647 TaxID=3154671 RepID=UPI0033AE960A